MMRIVVLLCLACLAFPAKTAAETCGDDARLGELPQYLAEGKLPETPITVTPATFFRLQPAVRKALGDNVMLCPKVPLKNGRPILRQKTDFPDIWEPLEIAVAAGDWETAELIAQSVRPNPLPAEALFSLLAYPVFDEKTMVRLGKMLGVSMSSGRFPWRYFLLDVFYALGGRAEKQEIVLWARNEKEMGRARSVAQARKDEIKFIPYSGMEWEQTRVALEKCGIIALDADAYIDADRR